MLLRRNLQRRHWMAAAAVAAAAAGGGYTAVLMEIPADAKFHVASCFSALMSSLRSISLDAGWCFLCVTAVVVR